MALGVSPISNDLNRAAMGFQASMLEQLGQQVRQDLRVVQTNRQLQGFAQQVQSVDPTAPDFAQKISGVMAQFPLAAQSPLGAAAINQLGAQRSFYQQQFMADKAFERQLGGLAAGEFIKNQPIGSPPPTRGQLVDVATGRTPRVEPPLPSSNPSIPTAPVAPVQGQPGMVPGDVVTQGAPEAVESIPVSVLNQLGAFEAELIRRKVPKPFAEKQLMAYQDNLMRQASPTGTPYRQQLNDGSGLIITNPDGTTKVVKYPEGARGYVPGSGPRTDPFVTNALKAKTDIEDEIRKDRASARANLAAMKAMAFDDPERDKRQASALAAEASAKSREADLMRINSELERYGKSGTPSVDSRGLPAGSSAPEEVALIGEDVIPSVRNAAEAQRLPKGTKFRDPFGNIRIVP